MCLTALAAPAMLVGCGQSGSPEGSPGGLTNEASTGDQGGFTVLLAHFSDPMSHAQSARDYKERLEQALGWRGLFVVHGEGGSELFWGRFPIQRAAEPTLRRAKEYRAQNGLQVFAKAMTVPLPAPPVGPPEWDLKNNPGTYALLVAAFQSDMTARPPYRDIDRQNDAVLHCTQLREQGYDAWYRHGPTSSIVAIGSFGPQAIRLQNTRMSQPRGQSVLVETMTIVDPTLKALQEQFPLLAVNGRESVLVTRDPQGNEVSRRSETTSIIRVSSAP